ncbi:hypothetical protein CC86DRAFT_466604 [Ophiobolus disseminans]|uniref:Heterokaryon incompatibility domain-containing protein n=1 Tax=Ophiobolus disseminans TaxID=1469910 RepID=A0A6A7A255_9PLEO|nr:hypothetical protein CC86DRAFT_466604 [Ophiobolus disseminans]
MTNQDPDEALERPKPYQYFPLDSKRSQIRLLSIPPEISGSHLAVNHTLIHTSLNDGRPFEALSYCWGDQNFVRELRINRQTMHITESLATALESIQSEEDILLWADAICVNQQDPIEKTEQAQLMRDIYKTASRVIIWLGPSTPDTHETMQEMQKLGSSLVDAGLWGFTPKDVIYWDVEDNDTSKVASAKRVIEKIKAEHLTKVRGNERPFQWAKSDLGKRKWFYRMWCIQECTNARIATFRCGNDEVDSTCFWAVSLYFTIFSRASHRSIPRSHPNRTTKEEYETYTRDFELTDVLSTALPTTIVGMRRKYIVTGVPSLRALLDTVSTKVSEANRMAATDPRDCVYALLGIANNPAAKEIITDYTLSAKPWSIWNVHDRMFHASGKTNIALEINTSHEDITEPTITLKGYFVDTIKETGHSSRHGLSDKLNWANTRPYFEDISHFLAKSTKYTPEQKKEAEWRIPVGDTEVTEQNVEMHRASATSNMKVGYAAARLMGGGTGIVTEEHVQQIRRDMIPFGSFCRQLQRMYDSQPFISEDNHVGAGPLEAQSGDAIVIFMRARVPYIIRKEGETRWMLVGESHVYGIMDGEFMMTDPVAEDITLC